MIKIALSRLGNDELYTFGNRIENLLSTFNVELLSILLYVNLFLSKLVIPLLGSCPHEPELKGLKYG
jgi:hypothetical protein